MDMSELRDLVINAHGGIDHWNKLRTVDGDMSITGLIWARKGWPDALKAVRVTIDTKAQLTRYRPFTEPDRLSICRPDHTTIATLDGKVLEERHHPRSAFEDHKSETKWDALNLAYFSGYAIWNYLTTPFIFALPGFKTEEIESWDEQGEQCRRLRVTFPESIATHCPEQIFHVGGDGLITRMDYSAQVMGSVPTAHYMSDYKDFGGIKLATKRRAYRRNPDGTAAREVVAVAIDIADIRLS
jgi:hypothetical protein